MMQQAQLVSSIASAAPNLTALIELLGFDPDMEIGESVIHLHAELLKCRENGRIRELQQIDPVIEQLLEENDEQDQVTLGFIEPLVWDALDGNLDVQATRQALGPIAQSCWDTFYLGARRNDLRPIQFEKQDLGPAASVPATLLEWLIRPNQWVESGASVARISVNSRPAELRVKVRCWIDRLATPSGHSLLVGDLLLYIAPESPKTPKDEQLCELVFEPAA